MPLSPGEAFGLFQAEVSRMGQQAEMLRVGLMGYQQTLQDNDRLTKENEALKAQLQAAGMTPQTPPPPQDSVTPFPGGQKPPDQSGPLPGPQG